MNGGPVFQVVLQIVLVEIRSEGSALRVSKGARFEGIGFGG